MVEMYSVQRYLQYDTLARNGLQHFDSWASTFGETVTALELSPEGTNYRAKTRFAKFYNLPELMQVCHLAFNLWNGYAEEGREKLFTPEELFCCEFAPYFMEGIKARYPEYCRDLPTPKKQAEHTR